MKFYKKSAYGCITVIILILIVLFISQENIDISKANEKSINLEVKMQENELESKEENINLDEEKLNNKKELEKLLSIKNDPLMILINKDNILSNSYIPSDLVYSEINFVGYDESRYLVKAAADSAKAMFDAAAKEGIMLLGASGYRSYETQENLYNSRVINEGQEEADRYTAKPGRSEHQLGLALDILSDDYQVMDEKFSQTEAYKWLKENCYKYGFILRYLEGKQDITGFLYEPWHYRYIGNSEVAKEIMDKNLTFEEYIEELNRKIEDLN